MSATRVTGSAEIATVEQFGVCVHYPPDDGRIVPIDKGAAEALQRCFDPEDATFYRRTVTYGEWEPVNA